MEPTKQDAIEEIEASRINEEKVKATQPRPSHDLISSASGAVVAAEVNYAVVCGDEYKRRPPMREADCAALVSLFEATHGHRWTSNSGWVGRKARGGVLGLSHFESHASHWHGVSCEIGEHNRCVVVGIDLSDNELEGEIGGEGTEGGQLVDRGNSPLSGRGGGGWGRRKTAAQHPLCRVVDLADLRSLDLSRNVLEGPLPSGLLLGLSDLEKLDVHGNELSGPLAPVLGLPSGTPATAVLSGRQQAGYGEVQEQQQEEQQEEGGRDGLGQHESASAHSAEAADCDYDDYEDEHQLLSRKSHLQVLNLSGNAFTGPLPQGLLGPPASDDFRDYGSAYGSDDLGSCSNSFSARGAGGSDEEGHGGGVTASAAEGGEGGGADDDDDDRSPTSESSVVSEPLPTSAERSPTSAAAAAAAAAVEAKRLFPSLLELDLSCNHLTGPIPSFLPPPFKAQRKKGKTSRKAQAPSGLRRLCLAGNALTGGLPWGLGGFGALKELDLSGNRLTGPVPPWVCGLSRLEVLDLSNNNLTGPLPTKLNARSTPKLARLCLQFNKLTGPVADSGLGTLGASLAVLNLSHNALTGRVPENVSNLNKLQVLLMHGNQGLLLCPMPSGLTCLTKLVDMSLIDSEPSQALPAPRRFDKRRFDTIRAKGKAHGFSSWEGPG